MKSEQQLDVKNVLSIIYRVPQHEPETPKSQMLETADKIIMYVI